MWSPYPTSDIRHHAPTHIYLTYKSPSVEGTLTGSMSVWLDGYNVKADPPRTLPARQRTFYVAVT